MNCAMRILAITLILAASLFGQAATTTTTLSAAVTATQTTVTLASATGVAANTTGLFVDGEFMPVIALSGTIARVQRGGGGGQPSAHASGATVYVGSTSQTGPFMRNDQAGACTAASFTVLPIINITNGKIFNCHNSQWWNISDPTGAVEAQDCGTAAGACAATNISPRLKIVRGTATSTSATPSTVAITGMSPAFTSAATYTCTAANSTTVANAFSVLAAGYVSGSAVTFTGPNTLTDVIRWVCIGY